MNDRVIKVPQSPDERYLPETKLREKTGGAPTPFWWPAAQAAAATGDERAPSSRPPSAAHSEFAEQALAELDETLQVGEPVDLGSHRDAYVHWLYAKSLGYQGFAVPLTARTGAPLEGGNIALTTPRTLKALHATMIEPRELDAETQEQLFSEFLSGILRYEQRRDPRVVELERLAAEAAEEAERLAAEEAAASRKKKRPGVWKPERRKPGDPKVTFAPAEQLPVGHLRPSVERAQRAAAKGEPGRAIDMLQEMHGGDMFSDHEYRTEETACKKLAVEWAQKVAAGKYMNFTPKELRRGAEQIEPSRAVEMLQEVREYELFTQREYREAEAKVRAGLEVAKEAGVYVEPEPEPEPQRSDEEEEEEEEPEPEPAPKASAAADAAEAEEGAGVEAEADAPVATEVPPTEEYTDVDLPPLVDCVGRGLSVDLLPHGCAFESAAELSFDVSALVRDYEGDALFCVLRQDGGPDSVWTPLGNTERLSISQSGVATVELQSLCRLMLVWVKGLEHKRSVIQMLKSSLVAGLESRGEQPDAEFRANFRLACVAAVTVSKQQVVKGKLQRTQVAHSPQVNASIQTQVASEIFADAERKEREAAAAAEALLAAEEARLAEEARIAGLPLMLHAACKKGKKGWMEDKDANPDGFSIEDIMDEGTDLHMWTDGTGYTALYIATMYEQEALVEMLIAAGSEVPPKDYVDKENNNGVTALMAAARDGFTSIVMKLLAAGADYAQVDEFGRTADSVESTRRSPHLTLICRDVSERLLGCRRTRRASRRHALQ